MNFVAEALNLSKFSTERLEERGILRRAFVKHPFFSDIVEAVRIEKKFGIYEEGTVIVKGKESLRVFRGFPKIRRILYLESGLKKHFGSKKIAVEEKMNGYNVRIGIIGENIYAITRRGLICPYTTEKAREKISKEFFDEYPEHMLCCEAIGKASPYVPDYYGIDDLEFFLFDVRESKTNKALSIYDKEEIAKRYGLKMVDLLLKTSAEDIENIKKTLEELNERGREGVVFKDLEMLLPPLKYTTSFSNCGDLSYAFKNFEEYGRDFMLARIIREAFQTFEFKDDLDKRAHRLGKAILSSAIESIRKVSEGKEVTELLTLNFSSEEILELFKIHLKLVGINLREIERREKNGRIEVKFERVMRATTDKIRSLLEGNPW
ncbi:MAG: RNA ligase [Archaeoglobaceae archaeon]|nr:RNA ligase [Archaeoglobaceae archaeon]MDW8128219.1 RNA ligase [Archaeoglobaceae archaeon]